MSTESNSGKGSVALAKERHSDVVKEIEGTMDGYDELRLKAADELVAEAIMALFMDVGGTIGQIGFRRIVHDFLGKTTAVIGRVPGCETFCVMSAGRKPIFCVHPDFALALACDDVETILEKGAASDAKQHPMSLRNVQQVLTHEALHLFGRHLSPFPSAEVEKLEATRPDLATIAKEIWCNALMLDMFGVADMPTTLSADESHHYTGDVFGPREASGVDPFEAYRDYVKGANKAGFTPLPQKEFLRNYSVTLTELAKLPESGRTSGSQEKLGKPDANQGHGPLCSHSSPASAGDADRGIPQHPDDNDDRDIGEAVQDVIRDAIDEAVKGDKNYRAALTETLFDAIDPEGIGDAFGLLGAGKLRSQKKRPARSNWKRFITGMLGSIPTHGCAPAYPFRSAAVYKAVGSRVPILPRGKVKKARLTVYVDTSGSMSAEILDEIIDLCGRKEQTLEVTYKAFDGVVTDWGDREGLTGGGGTNIRAVIEDVDSSGISPDAVLVITDGYLEKATDMKQPAKWYWLITPTGDDWPKDAGMRCERLPGSTR